jgi:hypothetical protein
MPTQKQIQNSHTDDKDLLGILHSDHLNHLNLFGNYDWNFELIKEAIIFANLCIIIRARTNLSL